MKVFYMLLTHILELQKEKGELVDKCRELEKEKENAELKAVERMALYSKMSDQLTKAKEYIKLLLMNCVGVYESTGKTIAEIQAEAEQFLQEE